MSQRVAAKMLNSPRGSVLSRSASPLRPMNRDFQLRFTAGLLILLAAANRPHLPRHWNLCSPAALDRAGLDSLLHFLPGVVCLLCVQVHRKAERFRLDNLLGQRHCLAFATSTLPAFCSDLS